MSYNENMIFLTNRNKYYEIDFVVCNDKKKLGREELHNYKEYIDNNNLTENKSEFIEPYSKINTIIPKDLLEEKRERNGVIGTTIVNILNNSSNIIKILEYYKDQVQKIDKHLIQKLYESIWELANKNQIYKIDFQTRMSTFYDVYNLIFEIYDTFEEPLYSLEIIEKIDKQDLLDSMQTEAKIIYNFIKEVYTIPNIQILESRTDDIIKECIENNTNNKMNTIETIYEYITINILKSIIFNIENCMKEYHFIITNYINHFIYDLQNIYKKDSKENIIYQLSKSESFYKITGSSILRYKTEILTYYKENYNQERHLQDIIRIFIDNLIIDIHNIQRVCTSDSEWKEYQAKVKSIYYDKYGKILDSFKEMEKSLNIYIIEDRLNNYDKEVKNADIRISKEKMSKVSYQRITSILNNTLSTRELPRVHIYETEIIDNNKIFFAQKYTYQISTLQDLLYTTLYHLEMDKRKILQCKICNRYFISDTKNSEIYCKRIDPFDSKHRSCITVGKSNTEENLNESLKSLKHKIENRLFNKEKYGEELKEYKLFKKEYKDYKQKLKQKEHNKEKMEELLYEWLKEYDKKLQKKYPSTKYGKTRPKKTDKL